MSLTKRLLLAEERDSIISMEDVILKTSSMFKVVDFLEPFDYDSFETGLFREIYKLDTIPQMIKELESYEKAFEAVPEDYFPINNS